VARRVGLALLAVTLLAPTAAEAAVTVGSDLARTPTTNSSTGCKGSLDCSATWVLFQLPSAAVTAPGGIQSPTDGVVVRFRIRTTTPVQPINPLRLRLAHDTGGGLFTGVGTGTAVTPANTAGIQTFPERLRIGVGDYIGVEALDGPPSTGVA
jgi:hypothetical protein